MSYIYEIKKLIGYAIEYIPNEEERNDVLMQMRHAALREYAFGSEMYNLINRLFNNAMTTKEFVI